MILKIALLPSLLLACGLVLLAIAMFAPRPLQPRDRIELPPSERVRGLERLAADPRRKSTCALRRALDDPDPQVAAVAAILLGDVAALRPRRFPWRR